ncbi:cytochrome b5-related isoform X2 [Rhynchophorus ferrugineus]|uniref:cytochrome b5-related isoform X2 n=1 Tax=Rhynchophorus ferrugineus TaxID=354439 RepID=UPI003FCD6CDA
MCNSDRINGLVDVNSFDMDMSKVFKSSLGIKYPSMRDHVLHSGIKWLEGRSDDDGAEGLWRIHDNLYDLTNFIKTHPGGRDWIELTKGTDITEAFESHHLSDKAEQLLPKYYVRKARTKRNFPWTFHEDGFYKSLKRNIVKELERLPQKSITKSKVLTDSLMVFYFSLFLISVYFKSFLCGILSGLCLGLLTVAAHNYFHQKDNFRRFYFDFSMMCSREWRISHVLSHHMYTNTISDLEVSTVEPFFQYLPGEKTFMVKYVSWIYGPLVYALLFIGSYLKTIPYNSSKLSILLPYSPLLLSWILTSQPILYCIMMFIWIITIASIHFSIVGLNAAHHHPDIFHDGDAIRPTSELDWGVFQLDAVMDRKDITGSHFLVLTNFGDHALHHLFPTLDHGILNDLYPVFIKTCKEFGVDWKLESQLELMKGQYRQLARDQPNKKIPKTMLKTSL